MNLPLWPASEGPTSHQLDQVLSQALKGLSRSTEGIEGVSAYGEYVFGYRPARHHQEMLDFILKAIYKRRNSVILEPRGGAKTTWGNTILLSYLACMYPDLRIGLISNTATQALDFSRAIRFTLESNDRHREIFGDCVSASKWRDMEWLHKDSKWHGSKDVTLYATGCGGPIISKRFDIVLCDDILDEENTNRPEAREKVENWFLQTLLPCLTPDGVVICIGTRWAEDDLYETLMTSIPRGGKGWDSKVVSALHEDEDGELSSFWPEHWSVRKLISMREEMGTPLFMCAMQNDIRGLMAGDVFQSRYFQYFDELPQDKSYTVHMGVDLASSEKERADYTARVTVARDQEGNYYVLSYYRDRRESGHAEFIRDGFYAYPAMGLVICESQQFQSTLIQEVMRDYPHIPIEGKRSDIDKTTRARAVAAKYEAHKVFHHRSIEGSDFEMEEVSFPKGHDDLVDALGFAMDLGGGGLIFGSLER